MLLRLWSVAPKMASFVARAAVPRVVWTPEECVHVAAVRDAALLKHLLAGAW